jgi:hypothetical protein
MEEREELGNQLYKLHNLVKSYNIFTKKKEYSKKFVNFRAGEKNLNSIKFGKNNRIFGVVNRKIINAKNKIGKIGSKQFLFLDNLSKLSFEGKPFKNDFFLNENLNLNFLDDKLIKGVISNLNLNDELLRREVDNFFLSNGQKNKLTFFTSNFESRLKKILLEKGINLNVIEVTFFRNEYFKNLVMDFFFKHLDNIKNKQVILENKFFKFRLKNLKRKEEFIDSEVILLGAIKDYYSYFDIEGKNKEISQFLSKNEKFLNAEKTRVKELLTQDYNFENFLLSLQKRQKPIDFAVLFNNFLRDKKKNEILLLNICDAIKVKEARKFYENLRVSSDPSFLQLVFDDFFYIEKHFPDFGCSNSLGFISDENVGKKNLHRKIQNYEFKSKNIFNFLELSFFNSKKNIKRDIVVNKFFDLTEEKIQKIPFSVSILSRRRGDQSKLSYLLECLLFC